MSDPNFWVNLPPNMDWPMDWRTDNTTLLFARLYAYLRDPQRSRGSNPEVAALWEELITNDCVGERFDAVVQRMMELDL